ncbi:MAG TPA: ParB N-terminal domain-containing protein, partial [Afifellaceae bacterium]|nr:ParB N-terminal domain-containing protein [Afifellaceae bacterium]
MSLKKRLESLSAGLGQEASTAQPPESARRPRTTPGQLMAFREHVLQADEQVADLRKRLELFEGATPAQRLDPKRIRPSEFANRHPDQFKTAAYETLKRDIAGTEGNVEAILVRPIAGNQAHDYEVVFGHRRHRACLELGIPVLALISEVSDAELWIAMFAENLDRE